MVQWPCVHLGLQERHYVDCRYRQTKVIRSGSVVMKINVDSKVCFPRWPDGGHIWSPIGYKFGKCKAAIYGVQLGTNLVNVDCT
jgi:hypothetical protein